MQLCAQRDQRRSQAGRIHKIRRSVISKNGVVAVLSAGHQRIAFRVARQQTKSIPEIPAARPLAEVTAHSSHVSHLRAGDSPSSLRECGANLTNPRVRLKFLKSDQRADAPLVDILTLRYAAPFLNS